MPKIDCISCGTEFESSRELDTDGVCEPCNLEDYCPNCNQHDLDCTCNNETDTDEDAFVYGFGDDDDPHDELDDWEGDDPHDELDD